MVSWSGHERRILPRTDITGTAWIVHPSQLADPFDVISLSVSSALLSGPTMPELDALLKLVMHVHELGWVEFEARVVRHAPDMSEFCVCFEQVPAELEDALQDLILAHLEYDAVISAVAA